MHSMTGFGSGAALLGGGRVTLEIRGLNHKHQDVRLRLPAELGEHASYLEQVARRDLGRGRYDISVRVQGRIGGEPTLDIERLKDLYHSLKKVHLELTPEQPLRLDALLSLPELVGSPSVDPEQSRDALTVAFDQAKDALWLMRGAEGAALQRELSSRLQLVKDLCERVQVGSADLVAHHRSRLLGRIAELISDPHVLSNGRLEQEVALVADRSDITEELVRLASHCDQLSVLLQHTDAVGRKLDFLLQEMGREVNTIGSKSQHAPIAHLVVALKSELERLREQAQNVA